jgi:hypothetical protein
MAGIRDIFETNFTRIHGSYYSYTPRPQTHRVSGT